jgi:signal peptidase II
MTMGSPTQKWPGLSLFLPVFCAVLIADQISKQIMLDLVFNPPRYIEIGLLLNIVPVWNSGMSFGMLADGGLAVRIGLTVLAFAVSGWFVWVLPKLDRLQRLAGAAIAGGAIGNAIDRLRFGRVVDFIDFHIGAWHWPAFNVADAAITIGAGLWAYSILFGQETNET